MAYINMGQAHLGDSKQLIGEAKNFEGEEKGALAIFLSFYQTLTISKCFLDEKE